MIKRSCFCFHAVCCWCLLVVITPGVWAQQASLSQLNTIPQVPKLPVKGYVLQDFHSGEIIAESNADLPLEPASITKIMTTLVAYDEIARNRLSLQDRVTISEHAARQEGSKMFLEANSQVTVGDLLMGIVVQSGNDASVALAEHIAGSEAIFVESMNLLANHIGMKNSHFSNVSGLPAPDHLTTARDIAKMTQALIANFPEQYASYAIKSFTFSGIEQPNRNKLLWQDESVDGVKTGHTSSAGYCLVASARRGQMRLIAVVLGAEKEADRFSATQQLLNYGFRFYETHKLYNAMQAVAVEPVWKGDAKNVALGFKRDIYLTIPKDRYPDIVASKLVSQTIEAPITQGQVLGNVSIQLDDRELAKLPLIALNPIATGSLISRTTDNVILFFKSLLP